MSDNDLPFDPFAGDEDPPSAYIDTPTSEAPWPRAPLPGVTDEEDRRNQEALDALRKKISARQVGELTALRLRQAEERDQAGMGDEPIKTFAPVNVNIDLDQLMQYFGMEYDEDGPTGTPNGDIRSQIMGMVADQLVKQSLQGKSFKDRLDAEISARLGRIVDEALERSFQPVDWTGKPKGERTTLAEVVSNQAEKFLAESLAEASKYDYDRGIGHKGKLKKFIETELDRKFNEDLKVAMTDAKTAILRAVTDKGAEFLAQSFADAATKVQASTVHGKVIGGFDGTI